MPINLIELEQPLEPVRFPNGREFAVRPFGPDEYQLSAALAEQPTDEGAVQLLKRCVPDATDADLATLTPRMAQAIVAHARHKLELVRRIWAAEAEAATGEGGEEPEGNAEAPAAE